MGRFANAGVRFHVDDLTPIGGALGGAIDIGAVGDVGIPENMETQSDDSGQFYDQSRSIVSHAPMIEFTTKSLRQAFTILGSGFYCYGGGTYPGNVDGTHPGLEVYGRRKHNCKSAAPGSNHAKFTSDAGLLIAGTLTASRGQDATLSVTAHCLSDDGSDPVAEVYNASLLATLVEEHFTLGHFEIAGVGFTDEVDGISLSWGIPEPEKLPDLGEVTPSSASVDGMVPVLSISGIDPSKAASLPSGTSCTHANTKIQLRKRADRGKFIDDATAEHISITLDGVLVRDSRWSGSGRSNATNGWRLETLDDGTNSPVVVNHSVVYDSDLTD